MSRRHQFMLPTYGGADFSPRDLPGIVLDADPAVGLTNDGTNVTAWLDSSGQGNDGTAFDNTVPFTASNSNFNNKPTVGFTSGNQERVCFDGVAAHVDGDDTEFTLYAVMMHTANSARNLLGAWSAAGSSDWSVGTAAATSPCAYRYSRTSSAGTDVAPVSSSVSITVSRPYVHVWRHQGTTFRGWATSTTDGNILMWNDVAANADTLGTLDKFSIGATKVSFGNAAIARVVVYTGQHTLAQINQMRAYLGPLYGITTTDLSA